MRRLNKLLVIFWFVITAPVYADINAVAVAPTNNAVGARVNLQLNISTSSNRNSTPISRLVPAEQALRRLQPSQSSLALRWNVRCTTGSNARSQEGVFQLDGAVVGRLGAVGGQCRFTSASTSTIDGRLSVKERVVIPDSVRTAVLKKVLAQPLSRLASRGSLTERVSLTLTRRFTDAGSSGQNAATAIIAFSVTVVAGFSASVNDSQLVSVSGETRRSLLSVSTTAAQSTEVIWGIRIANVGEGSRLTIRSSRIEFRTPGGQLLRAESRSLRENFDPRLAGNNRFGEASNLSKLRGLLVADAHAAPGSQSRISLRESIRVPAGVVRAARVAGSGVIRVSREFSDGARRVSASVDLPLGGVAGGAFQITRIDLRFTGGERRRVVSSGEPLQLVADLNYSGTGLLRATWEIASTSVAGASFFRPLSPGGGEQRSRDIAADRFGVRQTTTLVRTHLNSFQQQALRSPALPSDRPGRYIVRLRIDAPQLAFDSPVIEYRVVSAGVDDSVDVADVIPMQVVSPEPGERFSEGGRIEWKPVGLTSAYRYEIFDKSGDGAEMVTGAVVPGDKSSASLSALVADRLRPGRQYWWRIVAIDRDGVAHGVSEKRRLVFSER